MFIYEFLYRGGDTPSLDDDTWHVVLAQEREDINGRSVIETTLPLTPTMAEERGYSLSRIFSELNQTAINSAARVSDLLAEIETLKSLGSSAMAEDEGAKRSLLNVVSFGLLDKPK